MARTDPFNHPIAISILCFAITIASALAVQPEFFFWDDNERFFAAKIYDIRSLISAGEPPFLSLTSLLGGNHLAEYQLGVANPVTLITYLITFSSQIPTVAATTHALFYLTLIFLGGLFLAKRIGISRHGAALAAFLISTSNIVLFWYSSSWTNALVSMAWLLWSCWSIFSISYHRLMPLAVATFVGLTFSIGYLHHQLALAIIATIQLLHLLRQHRIREAITLILALGAGVLLAAPALLPTLETLSILKRGTGIYHGGIMTPDLSDLALLFVPFHLGRMNWEHYQLIHEPIFYAAWFFPLLYLHADRGLCKHPWFMITLTLGLTFTLLCLGPDHLGPARWPFRYIPLAHTFLLLSGILAFEYKGESNNSRIILYWYLFAFLIAVLKEPSATTLITIILVGLFIYVFTTINGHATDTRPAKHYLLFILSSLLICLITIFSFSNSRTLPKFTHNTSYNPKPALTLESKLSYTAFDYRYNNDENMLPLSGNMPQLRGHHSLNSYSPVQHRALTQRFCIDMFGSSCDEFSLRLTDTDSLCQQSWADLMRVSKVVFQQAPPPATSTQLRLHGMIPASSDNLAYLNVASSRFKAGTTLSCSTNHTINIAPIRFSNAQETMHVSHNDKGSTLVFARTWWPGYEASLNGKPIKISPYRNTLVSVHLAPGQMGILNIRFVPPHLTLAFALSGLGLLIALAVSGTRRSMNNATSPAGSLIGEWR